MSFCFKQSLLRQGQDLRVCWEEKAWDGLWRMLGVVVWEAFFYRKNATWLLFEDLQALVSVQRLWGDLGFSHVVWLVLGRQGQPQGSGAVGSALAITGAGIQGVRCIPSLLMGSAFATSGVLCWGLVWCLHGGG